MKTLFDILEPIEESLKIAYRSGGRIPAELLRDISIYRDFSERDKSKMQIYSDLANEYNVSEVTIRNTIRTMNIIIDKNH